MYHLKISATDEYIGTGIRYANHTSGSACQQNVFSAFILVFFATTHVTCLILFMNQSAFEYVVIRTELKLVFDRNIGKIETIMIAILILQNLIDFALQPFEFLSTHPNSQDLMHVL